MQYLLAILAVTTLQTPANGAQTCPQWEPAFRQAGLPAKTFSRIAWRESRCNPKSVSEVRVTGYPDVGLLQIQGSWRTVTYQICGLPKSANHLKALTKVSCNLRVAKYLLDHGGMAHWKGSSRP